MQKLNMAFTKMDPKHALYFENIKKAVISGFFMQTAHL